jgi:two-component system, chemotaxis family, protein-glutamate methylesterase/glutaminase
MPKSHGLVIVGASWGGLHALSRIVSGLPPDFAVPVAIVQHRSRDAGMLLTELLQDQTTLPVLEVDDKLPFEPGSIYVAPPDYHLLVERDSFALSLDEPVRFSRPSIDVAMSSAADTCGARTVGIVLTGANADGAQGLQQIIARGGTGIVQRPDEAECPVMPEAALKASPTARVMSLDEIVVYLTGLSAPAEAGSRAS